MTDTSDNSARPSKPSYEFLLRENARLKRDISTIYSRSAKRSPAHRIAHDSMTFNAVDEWNAHEPPAVAGPTVCWMPCERHKYGTFTMAIQNGSPAVIKCPGCDSEANAAKAAYQCPVTKVVCLYNCAPPRCAIAKTY